MISVLGILKYATFFVLVKTNCTKTMMDALGSAPKEQFLLSLVMTCNKRTTPIVARQYSMTERQSTPPATTLENLQIARSKLQYVLPCFSPRSNVSARADNDFDYLV